MGIFTRFTFRSLTRNRIRTVVSVIGVALACALLTAVITSAVSLTSMLEQRTIADEGSWQVEFPGITEEGLDKLRADERVQNLLTVAELGTIELGQGNAADYGASAFIKSWPWTASGDGDDESLLTAPQILSGRAPEAPGELLLPHFFEHVELEPCGIEAMGAIELGSELTLRAGTLTMRGTSMDGEPPEPYVATSYNGSWYDEDAVASFEEDLPAVSGTVVGFYRAYGYSNTIALQGNTIFTYDEDAPARAVSDGKDATSAYALISLKSAQDALAIGSDYVGYTAQNSYGTHYSLLRWQGVITSDAAIWNTIYTIVGVLAGVIIVAGVSLIYNSFAISVAERTRQFGLLASLGASRRQLRRTVYAEALIIGAAGIPAGIVLGLVGCAVVFAFTGEGLAAMVSDESGAAKVVLSAPALVISALLALITLLISAAIPAARASRVSAVDAIRQTQDVHLSRAGKRASQRAERAAGKHGAVRLGRMRGLPARLFGVPGLVAHRNLTRSASRGRVTVGALAVSVALLITSGSVSNVLGYANETTLDTYAGSDFRVIVDAASAAGAEGFVREDGAIDGGAFQQALARYFGEVRELSVDGAEARGYTTLYVADTIIPREMIDPGNVGFFDSMLADGAWSGVAYVGFLDDASWRAYVEELGLSADEFCDPAHPRAIAHNSYATRGDTYDLWKPLNQPGSIEVFSYADIDADEDLHPWGVVSNEQGERMVGCMTDEGDEVELPFEEAIGRMDGIEVGALADAAPAGMRNTGTISFFLPASAIDLAATMGFAEADIFGSSEGSGAVAADMMEAMDELGKGYPELDLRYDNLALSAQQARLMSGAIDVFITCFMVITGLIAVANVFNTLSNSLMLRQREFAVLRSIGMDERAFRRMIAYECASYALRGFLLGFALGCAVSWLLFDAMQMSYGTYEFALPWPQMALAAGIVLAVILASVAFALRRTGAGSVVETLRADAV